MTYFPIKPAFFALILLVVPFTGKTGDVPTEQTVVLLDLSDRLLKPHQPERDLQLIRKLLDEFVASAKRKMYIGSRDRIKFVPAPQAETRYDAYYFDGKLGIDMDTIPFQRKKAVGTYADELFSRIKKLYRQASSANNSSSYKGANLEAYFRNQLADDFPRSGQNHLYLITDGYIYFERNYDFRKNGNRYSDMRFIKQLDQPGWRTRLTNGDYGLIALPVNLQRVSVTCLELAPRNSRHQEMLAAVWKKWLGEMQAAGVELKWRTGLSSTTEWISRHYRARE